MFTHLHSLSSAVFCLIVSIQTCPYCMSSSFILLGLSLPFHYMSFLLTLQVNLSHCLLFSMTSILCSAAGVWIMLSILVFCVCYHVLNQAICFWVRITQPTTRFTAILQVKVKVPSLTTLYTNEECQRWGNWVWTTCPDSLRSCARPGIELSTSWSQVRHPTTAPPCHPELEDFVGAKFYTARVPLLMVTNAFGLGRRCWSSQQHSTLSPYLIWVHIKWIDILMRCVVCFQLHWSHLIKIS